MLIKEVMMFKASGIRIENHRTATCHWQILLRNAVSSTPRHEKNSNSQL